MFLKMKFPRNSPQKQESGLASLKNAIQLVLWKENMVDIVLALGSAVAFEKHCKNIKLYA